MKLITITLEVPDGVEVRFGSPPDDGGGEPLPEPWWAAPADERVSAVRTIPVGRNGSAADVCPVHHLSWKTVPGGVSRRTGRPYAAFVACPEPGCDEKPQVSRRTAS